MAEKTCMYAAPEVQIVQKHIKNDNSLSKNK